jgi:FkbM family methyltransferase
MKALLKQILKKLPIRFTKNQQYDYQSKKIISTVCNANSNTVDVGCHKGEILDLLIQQAPNGQHYGFEPIPDLYKNLIEKYTNKQIHIFDIALSNEQKSTSFNYVKSNPAYSGLIKRQYDKPNEVDEKITVQCDLVDNIIPENVHIHFIKIDVEGGELQVLQGAQKTIARCKPYIIFEHGLGASEFYDSTPEKVFAFFETCGMKLSTMKMFLENKKSFTQAEFCDQYYKKLNYYFVGFA